METLLELGYVTISYVPEKNCIVQTWNKFCTTDEYKHGQEKCLEFIIANGCKGLVSDTTNAGLLKEDALKWAAEILIPNLMKVGVNHVEVVLPQSSFTKMTLMNLEKDVAGYMRYYGSVESALAIF
jgi:hypothetical protein